MGPADSPVAEGWTPITKNDLFTWEKGYGWSVDLPRDDFSYRGRQSLNEQKVFHYGIVQNQGVRNTFKRRQRPIDIPPIRVYGDPSGLYQEHIDDVTRDAVLDPENLAFTVALPNGRYWVSLVIGDLQIPRYGIDVYANGYPCCVQHLHGSSHVPRLFRTGICLARAGGVSRSGRAQHASYCDAPKR